jgi:hypothetical protein
LKLNTRLSASTTDARLAISRGDLQVDSQNGRRLLHPVYDNLEDSDQTFVDGEASTQPARERGLSYKRASNEPTSDRVESLRITQSPSDLLKKKKWLGIRAFSISEASEFLLLLLLEDWSKRYSAQKSCTYSMRK